MIENSALKNKWNDKYEREVPKKSAALEVAVKSPLW